ANFETRGSGVTRDGPRLVSCYTGSRRTGDLKGVGLASELLCDFRHAHAEQASDLKVFLGRLKLALRAGDGGRTVGGAASRLGVNHAGGGVGHAHDDHS